MRFKRFFFVLVILFFFLCSTSFSLEPRLLWAKEFKGEIPWVSCAENIGDLIIVKSGTIRLFDKNGNTLYQWGPLMKRSFWGASISADGRYIAFGSGIPTEGEIYEEGYIHYFKREGKEIKEIWKKEAFIEYPWVSPNGMFIFLGMVMWEGSSLLLDKDKKILEKWDVGHVDKVLFSPDGNYFIVEPSCLLIDIQNKKIIRSFPAMEVTSISENAEYLGLIGRKEEEGLYNKEGKLILKGKFVISGDGRVVVKDSEGRIDVFKFPEMERMVSYPIKREENRRILVSYDGRIVVVFGKRTDKEYPYNLFIGDTIEKGLWGGLIPQLKKAIRSFLSRDGRYLVVINGYWSEIKTSIYYYQVF